MLSTFNEKYLQEKQLQQKQAESYAANINHEMRTPLASILFFLTFLLRFVQSLQVEESRCEKQKALKYLLLIQSQVQLVQSYVSDLLDLRQFKDGVF